MLFDVQVQIAFKTIFTKSGSYFNPLHLILTGPAASDIAWIGSGSADAFFHSGIHCWDMAAGVLIVTEAGGHVVNIDGSEFNLMGRQIVAAASKELAEELVSKLNLYKTEPEFDEHCPM